MNIASLDAAGWEVAFGKRKKTTYWWDFDFAHRSFKLNANANALEKGKTYVLLGSLSIICSTQDVLPRY